MTPITSAPAPLAPTSARQHGGTPTRLALTLHLSLLGLFLPCGNAISAAATAAPVGPHQYAVTAGSLGSQLNQLAAQMGFYLVADASLTQGLSGPARHGEANATEALHQLLNGSGLVAMREPDGSYILKKQPALSTQHGVSLTGDEMYVTQRLNLNGPTEDTGAYTTRQLSTATRLALSPRETPQSVSVVTRQQMDDQRMTSLEDAMTTSTGVTVVKESSYQSRFQSRGFMMDNVQEDGAGSSFQSSVSGMGSAESSSESPDLAIYDRLEILRGASGLLQGNGEPGGTVNLVRKKPTSDVRRTFSTSAGSWDNYRQEADVSGPLSQDGSLRGRFVGVTQKKGSFVNDIHSERHVMYGTLAYDLTPDTTLTTGLNWQKTRTVPDLYGVPMSTDYSSLNLSRDTFLGASWNQITFEKINTFAEIEHHFKNDWTLKSALNYTHATALGRFTGIFGNGTSGVGSSGTGRLNNLLERDNQGAQWSYNLSASGPFEWLGRSHELVAGVDYQKEHFDNLFGRITDTRVVNIYHWNPAALAEPTWPTYSNNYTYDLEQTGLFTTTRLTLADDWKLIMGARYSHFSYDNSLRNINSGSATNTHFSASDQLTPYGGLLWNFAGHYTWYLSYADIYKPQGNVDRYGNLLPAVTGKNYETGIKGEFFDGALNTSAALFRIVQQNRPLEDVNCPGALACYRADGEVESQGLELEAAGKLATGLQIAAGYTLTNSKYLSADDSAQGQRYSLNTPQHQFKLYTRYQLPGRFNAWTVGAGLTAQTDTTTSRGITQGGYTLFNANLNYRYNDNLSFNLAGYNLTDKVYYVNVANRHRGGNNFYGDPRNLMLTAKWTF
ncbi:MULTISPECIES: TonB-dependent siderophore receptor [Dickeya]|uniref:Outer membrane ferripyoverdine receptor n=1 Tax=Dickeya aquatica TaxID=1401087 RepID=A0A375A722_9GAMM|nr:MULTISPECIES: TonB-dependent receptor [Dickeya]SLM61797.1 Outer membrane ferripyoverdine receptor [Dickeya aquatica]